MLGHSNHIVDSYGFLDHVHCNRIAKIPTHKAQAIGHRDQTTLGNFSADDYRNPYEGAYSWSLTRRMQGTQLPMLMRFRETNTSCSTEIPPSPTIHSGASPPLNSAVSFGRLSTMIQGRLRRTYNKLSNLIADLADKVLDPQPLAWCVNLRRPRVNRAKARYAGFHSYPDLWRDFFVTGPLLVRISSREVQTGKRLLTLIRKRIEPELGFNFASSSRLKRPSRSPRRTLAIGIPHTGEATRLNVTRDSPSPLGPP